jgi:hypothetical protein
MQDFARLVDPALEINLKQSHPTIQSPILCAMNTIFACPISKHVSLPGSLWSCGGEKELVESLCRKNARSSQKSLLTKFTDMWSVEQLCPNSLATYETTEKSARSKIVLQGFGDLATSSERRKYFLDAGRRKNFLFNTDTVYGFDWFSPFIDWNRFEIHMGLHLDASKYLNGQPVRFFARTRDSSRIFFCVEFHFLPDD